MATQKERFADRILEMNAHCVVLLDAVNELDGTFFDNGWNTEGGDPITDSDITSRQITATEVGNFITLAQQLKNFFGNSAVTTGDYGATVNTLRHGGS